ncbi:hypothetical protein EV182_000473 [Spiromyces aspiralis]|uniref:Uncharacterized protein n=1 Tax=Spiromyces aspiralis TaxID=68401 RepID=A0ACC1HGY3_9FUNG|nr:hypothetical protein EV182_000473 [Spiromyces aspiralis]
MNASVANPRELEGQARSYTGSKVGIQAHKPRGQGSEAQVHSAPEGDGESADKDFIFLTKDDNIRYRAIKQKCKKYDEESCGVNVGMTKLMTLFPIIGPVFAYILNQNLAHRMRMLIPNDKDVCKEINRNVRHTALISIIPIIGAIIVIMKHSPNLTNLKLLNDRLEQHDEVERNAGVNGGISLPYGPSYATEAPVAAASVSSGHTPAGGQGGSYYDTPIDSEEHSADFSGKKKQITAEYIREIVSAMEQQPPPPSQKVENDDRMPKTPHYLSNGTPEIPSNRTG